MSPPWKKHILHIPHQRIVILLVWAALITACAGKGGSDMTPDQLLADIKQGTAPVIVDVRTQGEYESGHVPGAQHLPFYAMWSQHDQITAKPNDPIVVYCEHGPRAWIGKFALWTVGFKNIAYLDGHMSGWKQQGMPMEKPAEKSDE
jgi:rhodanese-related sulfurtransferase